ncbi:hypothetical protein XvhCFBP2543_13955 [Xanthomonas vasicola]|nr:hypothetical protein XvhCFBP2543_13955 [Xanthomonas vasicola]
MLGWLTLAAIYTHQAPSTKHQAPSTKQQATSNKQQATSNKQQATSNKQQWTSCQLGLLTLRQWLASPLDSATTCEDGRTENAGFRAVLCSSWISWVRCGLIQQ